MQDCIFCKIVRGEIPSRKIYEDDEILAFHDIQPVAPVHFMVIPKRHIASLADATADDAMVLGRILTLTGRLAKEHVDGFVPDLKGARVMLCGPDPQMKSVRQRKAAEARRTQEEQQKRDEQWRRDAARRAEEERKWEEEQRKIAEMDAVKREERRKQQEAEQAAAAAAFEKRRREFEAADAKFRAAQPGLAALNELASGTPVRAMVAGASLWR